MTTRDLKEYEHSQILSLIRDAASFFEQLIGKDAFQILEQLELECSWNILNSPLLERRIKVLSEFKDFIWRAGNDEADSQKIEEKKKFRYITKEKLKNWIISKKMLDYLFKDQYHLETFRRSIIIIKFLASQNALNSDIIERLWKIT